MSEFEVLSVPKDVVDNVWPIHIDMIRRGLTKSMGDSTTEEEMLANIKSGDFSMWAIAKGDEVEAVVVLSIEEQATRKVFIHMLAGKNINDWMFALEKELLKLKDLVGASCVEGAGRLGIAKFLAGRGWRKKAMIMELR